MIATTADISLAHMDLGYWALRMAESIRRPHNHRRVVVDLERFMEKPGNLEELIKEATLLA